MHYAMEALISFEECSNCGTCDLCAGTVREISLTNKAVFMKVAKHANCARSVKGFLEFQEEKLISLNDDSTFTKFSVVLKSDFWNALMNKSEQKSFLLTSDLEEIHGDAAEFTRFLAKVARTTKDDRQALVLEKSELYFHILDISSIVKLSQRIVGGSLSLLNSPEVNSLILASRGRILEPLAAKLISQTAREFSEPFSVQVSATYFLSHFQVLT